MTRLCGADIRAIGVGGGGGNALVEMRALGARARLWAANTDLQALAAHPAEERLHLGPRVARGLGSGGRPSVGSKAAEESAHLLEDAVEGADLVFVAAGLGGGTGTGGAPVVAELARAAGALTVGVVTLPFGFEGGRRRQLAAQGLAALEDRVDALLVIPNDRLVGEGNDPTLLEAFARADRVLSDAVRGVSDLVLRPGLINLDFADLAAVLRGGGRAVMGSGRGVGASRASDAVDLAMRSPLLADDRIDGARGVLLSFTVDPRLGLGAIHQAVHRVQALVDDDAEILFGVAVDPNLHDEVEVTLVAAGLSFESDQAQRARVETSPRAAPVAAQTLDPALVAATRRRNALVML